MLMEKAILAGFRARGVEAGEVDDDYLELARLAETSGAEVIGVITQKETSPTPGYYVGKGKAAEIAEAVKELEADLVIFNNELSPMHFRNLEKEFGVKVIDRTQLILDIFAMRAHSSEGKIQVELAQLEYLLPRMAGKGIELSRLGGGIGTRGPGETKLEADRRRIRMKISMLKKKLEKVEKSRATRKSRREKRKTPVIALVGYTNAGKTTLFNSLSAESAFVEDKLFATLDPLTRKVFIPGAGVAVLVDTVGFIQNLPVKLVESFKSTLEDMTDAHLLLHVVDINDPRFSMHIEEVRKITHELHAQDIPTILVLNKSDILDKPDRADNVMKVTEDCVCVSAKKKLNMDGLKRAISAKLAEGKTADK